MLLVRLACLNHAASVHSEPGSNSPKESCAINAQARVKRLDVYNSKKYDR